MRPNELYEFIRELNKEGWEYAGMEVTYETREGKPMTRVGFISPWKFSQMQPHSLKLELYLFP